MSMGSISEDNDSVSDVNVTQSSMDDEDDAGQTSGHNQNSNSMFSTPGGGGKERTKSSMSESTTGTDCDETDVSFGEMDPLARLLTTPTRKESEDQDSAFDNPAGDQSTDDQPPEKQAKREGSEQSSSPVATSKSNNLF